MLEAQSEHDWKALTNPFRGRPEIGEMVIGHVSGRSSDIQEIVMGGQAAIILSGAPHIGKTSLVRYLQRPSSAEWSWRDELASLELYTSNDLDEIYFAQIDLMPLEGIANVKSLLESFVAQCTATLQSIWLRGADRNTDMDHKGLRELLRRMTREHPDARYFVMLDTIERLQQPDMPALTIPSKAQTAQERAMALLDDCGAIRLLVDLMDEFTQLGVILSIDSQPSPNIGNQFIHISADLARFRTMTLQTYTYNDTQLLLAQRPESFGTNWARHFRDVGGDVVFSNSEQQWLYEQAGSHPYLLQQICFHTFHFKRESALKDDSWRDLQNNEREQLLERVSERVSTSLDSTWKRIRASLVVSSQTTRERFYDFIIESRGKSAREEIDAATWNRLGSELRYILYSEGIVRYDPLQPVYYPGSVLLNYLAQRVEEQGTMTTPVIVSRSQVAASSDNELIITLPDKQPQHLELTSLEYALMKTLLHYPGKCSEEALMRSAWGKITGKQVLTQRIFHLRKKLRDACNGEEMIENIYGGFYALKHSEWFSWR